MLLLAYPDAVHSRAAAIADALTSGTLDIWGPGLPREPGRFARREDALLACVGLIVYAPPGVDPAWLESTRLESLRLTQRRAESPVVRLVESGTEEDSAGWGRWVSIPADLEDPAARAAFSRAVQTALRPAIDGAPDDARVAALEARLAQALEMTAHLEWISKRRGDTANFGLSREIRDLAEMLRHTLRGASTAPDDDVGPAAGVVAQLAAGDRAASHRNWDRALAAYQRAAMDARAWLARRGDAPPAEALRSFAVAEFRAGEAALAAGRLDDAAACFDRALPAATALARQHPDDARHVDAPARVEIRRGDVARARGDVNGALTAYARALGLRRAHASSRPADGTRRNLSIAYAKLGEAAAEAGRVAAARRAFAAACTIRREAVAASPDSALARRDLSVALERVGDAAMAAGDADAGLRAHAETLELRMWLVETSPADPCARRDLSVAYERVAEVGLAAGRAEMAERSLRAALELRRTLADAAPDDAIAARDLWACEVKNGAWALAAGRLDAAGELYRSALTRAQSLSAAGDGDPRRAADLSHSLTRMGDWALAVGDSARAIAAYDMGRAIRLRLAETYPESTNAARAAAEAWLASSQAAAAANDEETARSAAISAADWAARAATLRSGGKTDLRSLRLVVRTRTHAASLALGAGAIEDAASTAKAACDAAGALRAAGAPDARAEARAWSVAADTAIAAGRLDDADAHLRAARVAAAGTPLGQSATAAAADRAGDVALLRGDLDAARTAWSAALRDAFGPGDRTVCHLKLAGAAQDETTRRRHLDRARAELDITPEDDVRRAALEHKLAILDTAKDAPG